MAREATYTLYVNLSASQTRKRLKGHGFGVRKVEAADRNQAVIIHTATGGHLRQLQALFADVTSADSQQAAGTPVENLRNLGATSAAWLREVGIQTQADLEQLGPVLAYQAAKRNNPSVSLNLLWAIAAALSGRNIQELTDDEKSTLRAEAEA